MNGGGMFACLVCSRCAMTRLKDLKPTGGLWQAPNRPLNGTCVNCSVCVSIPDVLDVLARRLTDTCLRIRRGSIQHPLKTIHAAMLIRLFAVAAIRAED